MNGLERVDVGRMSGVHFIDVGWNNAAGAARAVAVVNTKILDLQPADGRGHPAVLIAMVVNAAGLADLPTDGHAFEDFVLEDEIARVVALRKIAVFVERLRARRMADDVVLDVFESEIAPGDRGETLDPIGNRELFGCDVLCHQAPPIHLRPPGDQVQGDRQRADWAIPKEARITLPELKQRFASTDGSVRYLFGLPPSEERLVRPASVEAVFMPSEGRQTICVSTQAGCAVDCHFCMTAQLGLIRNLTSGEILAQVLVPLEEHKAQLAPQTNTVLMGQGEPLLNFEPVMVALRIMLDPEGLGI